MRISDRSWPNGWRLTGLIGAALVAMSAVALLVAPDPVAGARLVIRMTARTSLILFLLAFVATALRRLAPSPFTSWLRKNRRYVGVSFAASHAIHLVAIIALAQLDFVVFRQLTNVVSYVGVDSPICSSWR